MPAQIVAAGGTARGFHAQFAELGDGWGLKWYRDVDRARHCYGLQTHAAQFGLAPECRDWFECDEASGFTTQIVERCEPVRITDSPEHRRLHRQLMSLCGIIPHDATWRNTGYLPDGRLVLFDFSECRYR
jgi:hypothetical protein